MTGTRLVVVLGYSDRGCEGLHPICAARLERAADVTTEDDVVVLSGWARLPDTQSEAELMRDAWRGAAREVVVDPDARTTVDNLANALHTRPAVTQYPRISKAVGDSISAVLLGEMQPQEALDQAAEQSNAFLNVPA